MSHIPIWLRLVRLYCHYSPLMRGKSRLITWAYHRFNASSQYVESTLDRSLKLGLHLNIWVDFNIYCWGLYEYHLANYIEATSETRYSIS